MDHLVVSGQQLVQQNLVHLQPPLLQDELQQVQGEAQVPMQRPGHRGCHQREVRAAWLWMTGLINPGQFLMAGRINTV